MARPDFLIPGNHIIRFYNSAAPTRSMAPVAMKLAKGRPLLSSDEAALPGVEVAGGGPDDVSVLGGVFVEETRADRSASGTKLELTVLPLLHAALSGAGLDPETKLTAAHCKVFCQYHISLVCNFTHRVVPGTKSHRPR